MFATCGGASVKVWSSASLLKGDLSAAPPAPLLSFTPHSKPITSLSWNANGICEAASRVSHSQIGAVLASAGEDGSVQLYAGTSLVGSLGDNKSPVHVAQFSNGSGASNASRYVCAGSEAGTVAIWDAQSSQSVHLLRSAGPVHAVALYANDTHVASGGRSAYVVLHSLLNGVEAGRINTASSVRYLHASPFRANMLAGALDDGGVVVWDAAARAVSQALSKVHNAPVNAVCFSPTNRALLVSAALDRAAQFFDLAQKRSIRTLQYDAPLHSAAFSTDGNYVAFGAASGRVLLFDMRASQQPMRTFAAHTAAEPVRSVAFTSSTLVSATPSIALPRVGPSPALGAAAAVPQTPLNKALTKATDVMEVFSPVAGDSTAPPPSASTRPPIRPLLPNLAVSAGSSSASASSSSAIGGSKVTTALPSVSAAQTKPQSVASIAPASAHVVTSPSSQPSSSTSSPSLLSTTTPKAPASSSHSHRITATVVSTANSSNATTPKAVSSSLSIVTPSHRAPPKAAATNIAVVSNTTFASPHDSILSPLASAPRSSIAGPSHNNTPSLPLITASAHTTINGTPASVLLAVPPSPQSPNVALEPGSAISSREILAEHSRAGIAGASGGGGSNEVIDRLSTELRSDIRAMHLDMLRQFHAHQSDTAALISAALAPLLDELTRLRAENAELRRRLP